MFVCHIYCSLDTFTVTGRDVGDVRYASLKRDESGEHDGWKVLSVRNYCIA